MSSAYHPQTDGQTKVVNRCLETYLKCFVNSQPQQWPRWVPWAEFWFDMTYSSSTAHRYNEKLSPRFYGPFVIKDIIGTVAYRLALPPLACIHDVFHVSQLKKATFPLLNSQHLSEALNEDFILKVEPEVVLKKRRLLNGQWELLIQWKGLPPYENTWEDFDTINSQFRSFHLEDKVVLLGEGNDELPGRLVYNKKGRGEK
ncbi:uncharacterized protein LOC116110064 [Pistacia vera]|uniref:uncharacterized protein LOC116110064 n=1 Tax=Pistacia vera TaxID=55513 RepID=UPI00126328FB|nr:uncharacterized protein LOC116110064 [Pistacia vera]